MALDQAITEFLNTLSGNRQAPSWREAVRDRLAEVRLALLREPATSSEPAVAAQSEHTEHDRMRLLGRLAGMGPRITARPDTEVSFRELSRLAVDLEHYRQRLHDMIYDSVSVELGGSE